MELDKGGTGYNYDRFQSYQDARNVSGSNQEHNNWDDDMESNHSWNCIGTPLPSPPGSPLPGASNKEVDEDKDGFLDITTEDYCEYLSKNGLIP